MECIYCKQNIPDNANFCPFCAMQIRCKECGETLIQKAKVCINCGKYLKESDSSSMNTIEFSETKNSRSFKASFTDTVGGCIGEAVGLIINNKLPNKVAVFKQKELASPEIIPHINNDDEEIMAVVIDDELEQLNQVFRKSNGKITLQETRLKAKSKRDAGIRLTLMFMYYQYKLGTEEILRSDLTNIMRDASLEDSNWRYWLVNNNLVGVKDDKVELKAPGRDAAKEFLLEIMNSEIEDKWKLGTSSRSTRKTKKKEGNDENTI
ncbi:zinc ribbon domain-containing protein [Coprobacter tertius]|uniref:Zinc ribbon domain-containing protein n=1 Tax=Coprobacter tertius TaxID=2944915 RepID=A0ABT1MJG6_9BACT|nr:zinc ribbon domain-containing protein [Coprobacter tertius]MCP9612762.1 zinc ribbon domain-containing protein [Coprobacter tertius]